MEHESEFVGQEEELDPNDVDVEGEEIKTSKECQTLHEHMNNEINDIIKSLGNDERIKEIIKGNKPSQAIYQKKKEETKQKVISIAIFHKSNKLLFGI